MRDGSHRLDWLHANPLDRLDLAALLQIAHRGVMPGVEPRIEEIRVAVRETGSAEARDVFFARDALERGPDFRESHDRRPCRRTNVAISGRQRMRTGGIAPMPRLTYINTGPTR